MSKRDLLRKLRSIRSTERGIVPDQAWVLRTRGTLMDKVRRADALAPLPVSLRWREAARTFAPSKLVQLMRAPTLATLSVIGAVLGGSLMSVSASERSVPGDFLYPIKLASEQTRLALTADKADRVRLKTEFVDRRVEEIKTIVKASDKKDSARLREAALTLKRDLNTVKNQLNEVKEESSAPEAAELAKLVDETSVQVTEELKQVKSEVPLDVKSAVAEAESQAVQTGVAAVAVMIESETSDEDITRALEGKIEGLRASIEDTNVRLQSASGSSDGLGTTSTTVPQIATASSTLSEVTALISENKLDQATDKLAEAAKATSQAEVATELYVASSTSAVPPAPLPAPLAPSSTSPTITSTSTTPSTSTSTPPIPPPN